MKKVKNGKQMLDLLEVAKNATLEEMTVILKKLALDGFRDLVLTTPFDTGYASAGWRVGVGFVIESIMPGPAPGMTYPPAQFPGAQITAGDVVHLYNNVEYIGALENGSSQQAPNGMIEQTYSKLAIVADNLANTLSARKSNV